MGGKARAGGTGTGNNEKEKEKKKGKEAEMVVEKEAGWLMGPTKPSTNIFFLFIIYQNKDFVFLSIE